MTLFDHAHASVFLPDPLREDLRPRLRRSILELAREKLRIVEGPYGSDAPVLWSPESFPPQETILTAIGDTRWSSVTIMSGPQTAGKTLIITAVLIHGNFERRMSTAYISSNVNLAVTQWGKKFKPTIDADAELSLLIPENPDFGGKKEERKFTNGTSMHFAGADSVGNLSGFTAGIIVCDDVQAYPKQVGHQGHPADYAKTRAKSFPREKRTIVNAGTPGMVDDYLSKKLQASACFMPFVPCLACETYQLIEFERMVYDDSDVIQASTDCWMRCANSECSHEIRFEALPVMLSRMKWVSMPPGVDWISSPATDAGTSIDIETADIYPDTSRRTDACGFWLNALYWPMGDTWGEVAATYVSVNGDPDSLKEFNQNTLGRPQRAPEPDEDKMTAEQVQGLAVKGHKFGQIPLAAGPEPAKIALTTCIDVQAGYLYVTVRAWRRSDGTSWLVYARTVGRKKDRLHDREKAARILEALEDVYRMDAEGWEIVDAEQKVHGRIQSDLFLVDAGYMQDVIFAFVNARGGERGKWRAVRGSKLPSKSPQGEIWPKVAKSRVGRKVWREPHVNRVKHILRELMTIPPDQPGSWNLPNDMDRTTLRAYAAHLTSERYDALKDAWKRESANHYLDCEVAQVVAAIAVGVPIRDLNSVVQTVKPMTLAEFMKRRK